MHTTSRISAETLRDSTRHTLPCTREDESCQKFWRFVMNMATFALSLGSVFRQASEGEKCELKSKCDWSERAGVLSWVSEHNVWIQQCTLFQTFCYIRANVEWKPRHRTENPQAVKNGRERNPIFLQPSEKFCVLDEGKRNGWKFVRMECESERTHIVVVCN